MNILSILNEYVAAGFLLAVVLTAAIYTSVHFRRKTGTRSKKATGVILALEKLALAKEHQVEVKILVMVMPERSRNFVGELVETVPLTELLLMKIGDKIAVEYSGSSKLVLSRQRA